MILLPEEALPVDVSEIKKALAVLSGGAGKRIELQQQEFGLPVADPRSGKRRLVRFIDSTLSQALAGLKGAYAEDDRQLFLSLCWRLAALAGLIRAGVLERWVTPTGLGQTAVPELVLEVAASLPLAGQLGFDPGSFLAALPETSE
jgi:hypothetical protein